MMFLPQDLTLFLRPRQHAAPDEHEDTEIPSTVDDTSQKPEDNAQPPVNQQGSTSPRAPVPISKAKQEPQIPSIPEGLPSQVEDTLGECPRFRIVLVGKSGIGKSSLIANIFNLDKDKIDIAHNTAGNAEIEYGYTSPENLRFILHDSKGFEAGSGDNWTKVQKFLEKRQGTGLLDKVHAIWFCVQTPRSGARLLQTGDEKLLQLAQKHRVPVITVFTKYDILVNQFLQKDKANAERDASVYFADKITEYEEDLKRLSLDPESISHARVSTKETNAKEMYINLTDVTRSKLQDVEHRLDAAWVTAQQSNARQKVEVSISEGFKKYWKNLGESSAFEGQVLIDCIHRLHEDVLTVWNFNDPTGILSGISFFVELIGFVKPLIENTLDGTSIRHPVSAFGDRGATDLVTLLKTFGHKSLAIYYLYDKYQQYPSTAKLLATYIINLVLVLHGIFTDTLSDSPPRILSNSVVAKAIEDRKTALQRNTLDRIDSVAEFSTHPEQVIEREILKQIPQESVRSMVAV